MEGVTDDLLVASSKGPEKQSEVVESMNWQPARRQWQGTRETISSRVEREEQLARCWVGVERLTLQG